MTNQFEKRILLIICIAAAAAGLLAIILGPVIGLPTNILYAIEAISLAVFVVTFLFLLPGSKR